MLWSPALLQCPREICELTISGMLQVTPYASDELVLIVPRHHALAKRSSIELGELQNLPLVSLNQVCVNPVPRIFNFTHVSACVSDSPPFQCSACAAPPAEALLQEPYAGIVIYCV